MPEGPLGAPRLTDIGPLSRRTEKEIRNLWDECPDSSDKNIPDKFADELQGMYENRLEICKTVKEGSIAVLENQGLFAEMNTPKEINEGACHAVAKYVTERLEYTNWRMTMSAGHSWVEYKGMNYDSEVPRGIVDPFDLPTLRRGPSKQELLKSGNRRRQWEDLPFDRPENIQDIIIEPTDGFKKSVDSP